MIDKYFVKEIDTIDTYQKGQCNFILHCSIIYCDITNLKYKYYKYMSF